MLVAKFEVHRTDPPDSRIEGSFGFSLRPWQPMPPLRARHAARRCGPATTRRRRDVVADRRRALRRTRLRRDLDQRADRGDRPRRRRALPLHRGQGRPPDRDLRRAAGAAAGPRRGRSSPPGLRRSSSCRAWSCAWVAHVVEAPPSHAGLHPGAPGDRERAALAPGPLPAQGLREDPRRGPRPRRGRRLDALRGSPTLPAGLAGDGQLHAAVGAARAASRPTEIAAGYCAMVLGA